MGQQLIASDLPIMAKPAPCDRCRYYKKCAEQKTACHIFYAYVVGSRRAPLKKARCKTFFRALQYEDDVRGKIDNFISTVLCARSSKDEGIFYDRRSKTLLHQKRGTANYSYLMRHRAYEFIGCFGPSCKDQRICNIIERHLYHEQN